MKKFEKLSSGKFKAFEITQTSNIIGGLDKCIHTFRGYKTDIVCDECSNDDLECVDTAEVD